MKPPRESPQTWKRYGLALSLAGLALAIRATLPFAPGTSVYQLPLGAVMLSAWLAGRGPGYLAAAMCAGAIWYWLLPPEGSFLVDSEHVLGFLIFVALCVMIVEFSVSRWRIDRELRASALRLEAAERIAHVGWWERDYATGRVFLSDETCRIFGVQPVDLPQWHGRWLGLIHADDRERVAAATAAAVAGGPRYDVEYRVVRPDGTVRVVHSQGDVTFDAAGRPLRQFGVMQDITELRRAEREARVRQELLDLAQQAAQAVAFDWHIGARENENRWSPELEALYGLEPGSFDGTYQGWRKLVHPEDWPAVKAAIERANRTGDVAADYRVVHANGDVRWLRAKGRMFFDAEGRSERMLGFMIDVTDWKRAEQSLRDSETYLAESQRMSHTGSWARDVASGKYIYTSEESDRIWGFEPGGEKPSGQEVSERIHPEDRAAWKRSLERTLREKADTLDEYRIVLPGGSVRHLRTIRHPILDSDGNVVRIAGTSIDITEQKRVEDELRASEARFRKLTELSSDWYWKQDENLRFTFAVDEKAGFPSSSLGKTRWELPITPLSQSWDDHRAVLAARKPFRDFEYSRVDAAGRTRYISVSGTPLFDERGEFAGYEGVASDITARKAAAEALRDSEARFRTFVDHATDAFFLHDDETLDVVDVNRQACESLGYTREELVGMHPARFDAALDPAAIAVIARRVGAGETVTFETRHRRKDGSTFPVEVRVRRFERGGRAYRLSLVRDNTERKLAEEALRGKDKALEVVRAELARVSRLTTLGELTASIAHEVNQPLGAMVANAGACTRWLSAAPPQLERAQQTLERIAADGRRASEVIARIRALAKRHAPRKDRLDLNRKISEVLALVEHEARDKAIEIDTRLDAALPPVVGDRVQLQQVLLNLVMNAIDAMSAVEGRPRELTIVTKPTADGAVTVEVRDCGVGLDTQAGERLFEAFYTTKPEGLGIGLSISRSIIRAHGGELHATANVPHGAVFAFSLPAAGEGA